MTFDIRGAAQDLDAYARRYGLLYAQPEVAECLRLLHRNPWAAPSARRAIEEELKRNPGKAIGLDVPLFQDRPYGSSSEKEQ